MRPRDRRTLLATWGWDIPHEDPPEPERPDAPGTVVLDLEAEDWRVELGKVGR